MYSEETVKYARANCRCCPDCADFPCEGSLNWDGHCENNSCKCEPEPPKCHLTNMELECADDGCEQVEFWECKHCGHTIEESRTLAG